MEWLDVLREFFLGETYVECSWLVNVHIYIGNTCKKPSRRTQKLSRHYLGSVNRLSQTTPRLLTDAPSMGRHQWTLILVTYRGIFPTSNRNYNLPYGPCINLLAVVGFVDAGCVELPYKLPNYGVNGKLTPHAKLTLGGLFNYFWVQ